jgi:hypothetical protein
VRGEAARYEEQAMANVDVTRREVLIKATYMAPGEKDKDKDKHKDKDRRN